MKGKMKGFGLYLIILVCLLAGVSYVVSQTQQTETLSYNQIYNYFMDGDVDQYDVDDTTLTMHLKKENQTYTYDLGDYRSVFYNDLGETIQQQMRDGTLFLAKTCYGAGLGGKTDAYRDGSYDYYISETVGSYDIKGTGAYIQAACAYEGSEPHA